MVLNLVVLKALLTSIGLTNSVISTQNNDIKTTITLLKEGKAPRLGSDRQTGALYTSNNEFNLCLQAKINYLSSQYNLKSLYFCSSQKQHTFLNSTSNYQGRKISSNLCIVSFRHTSLQNKQNTYWSGFIAQNVVIICGNISNVQKLNIHQLSTSWTTFSLETTSDYLLVAFIDLVVNGALFSLHLVSFRLKCRFHRSDPSWRAKAKVGQTVFHNDSYKKCKRSCFNIRRYNVKNGVSRLLQGWRSGESARLPVMCPGFNSRTRRHWYGLWLEWILQNMVRHLNFCIIKYQLILVVLPKIYQV